MSSKKPKKPQHSSDDEDAAWANVRHLDAGAGMAFSIGKKTPVSPAPPTVPPKQLAPSAASFPHAPPPQQIRSLALNVGEESLPRNNSSIQANNTPSLNNRSVSRTLAPETPRDPKVKEGSAGVKVKPQNASFNHTPNHNNHNSKSDPRLIDSDEDEDEKLYQNLPKIGCDMPIIQRPSASREAQITPTPTPNSSSSFTQTPSSPTYNKAPAAPNGQFARNNVDGIVVPKQRKVNKGNKGDKGNKNANGIVSQACDDGDGSEEDDLWDFSMPLRYPVPLNIPPPETQRDASRSLSTNGQGRDGRQSLSQNAQSRSNNGNATPNDTDNSNSNIIISKNTSNHLSKNNASNNNDNGKETSTTEPRDQIKHYIDSDDSEENARLVANVNIDASSIMPMRPPKGKTSVSKLAPTANVSDTLSTTSKLSTTSSHHRTTSINPLLQGPIGGSANPNSAIPSRLALHSNPNSGMPTRNSGMGLSYGALTFTEWYKPENVLSAQSFDNMRMKDYLAEIGTTLAHGRNATTFLNPIPPVVTASNSASVHGHIIPGSVTKVLYYLVQRGSIKTDIDAITEGYTQLMAPLVTQSDSKGDKKDDKGKRKVRALFQKEKKNTVDDVDQKDDNPFIITPLHQRNNTYFPAPTTTNTRPIPVIGEAEMKPLLNDPAIACSISLVNTVSAYHHNFVSSEAASHYLQYVAVSAQRLDLFCTHLNTALHTIASALTLVSLNLPPVLTMKYSFFVNFSTIEPKVKYELLHSLSTKALNAALLDLRSYVITQIELYHSNQRRLKNSNQPGAALKHNATKTDELSLYPTDPPSSPPVPQSSQNLLMGLFDAMASNNSNGCSVYLKAITTGVVGGVVDYEKKKYQEKVKRQYPDSKIPSPSTQSSSTSTMPTSSPKDDPSNSSTAQFQYEIDPEHTWGLWLQALYGFERAVKLVEFFEKNDQLINTLLDRSTRISKQADIIKEALEINYTSSIYDLYMLYQEANALWGEICTNEATNAFNRFTLRVSTTPSNPVSTIQSTTTAFPTSTTQSGDNAVGNGICAEAGLNPLEEFCRASNITPRLTWELLGYEIPFLGSETVFSTHPSDGTLNNVEEGDYDQQRQSDEQLQLQQNAANSTDNQHKSSVDANLTLTPLQTNGSRTPVQGASLLDPQSPSSHRNSTTGSKFTLNDTQFNTAPLGNNPGNGNGPVLNNNQNNLHGGNNNNNTKTDANNDTSEDNISAMSSTFSQSNNPDTGSTSPHASASPRRHSELAQSQPLDPKFLDKTSTPALDPVFINSQTHTPGQASGHHNTVNFGNTNHQHAPSMSGINCLTPSHKRENFLVSSLHRNAYFSVLTERFRDSPIDISRNNNWSISRVNNSTNSYSDGPLSGKEIAFMVKQIADVEGKNVELIERVRKIFDQIDDYQLRRAAAQEYIIQNVIPALLVAVWIQIDEVNGLINGYLGTQFNAECSYVWNMSLPIPSTRTKQAQGGSRDKEKTTKTTDDRLTTEWFNDHAYNPSDHDQFTFELFEKNNNLKRLAKALLITQKTMKKPIQITISHDPLMGAHFVLPFRSSDIEGLLSRKVGLSDKEKVLEPAWAWKRLFFSPLELTTFDVFNHKQSGLSKYATIAKSPHIPIESNRQQRGSLSLSASSSSLSSSSSSPQPIVNAIMGVGNTVFTNPNSTTVNNTPSGTHHHNNTNNKDATTSTPSTSSSSSPSFLYGTLLSTLDQQHQQQLQLQQHQCNYNCPIHYNDKLLDKLKASSHVSLSPSAEPRPTRFKPLPIFQLCHEDDAINTRSDDVAPVTAPGDGQTRQPITSHFGTNLHGNNNSISVSSNNNSLSQSDTTTLSHDASVNTTSTPPQESGLIITMTGLSSSLFPHSVSQMVDPSQQLSYNNTYTTQLLPAQQPQYSIQQQSQQNRSNQQNQQQSSHKLPPPPLIPFIPQSTQAGTRPLLVPGPNATTKAEKLRYFEPVNGINSKLSHRIITNGPNPLSTLMKSDMLFTTTRNYIALDHMESEFVKFFDERRAQYLRAYLEQHCDGVDPRDNPNSPYSLPFWLTDDNFYPDIPTFNEAFGTRALDAFDTSHFIVPKGSIVRIANHKAMDYNHNPNHIHFSPFRDFTSPTSSFSQTNSISAFGLLSPSSPNNNNNTNFLDNINVSNGHYNTTNANHNSVNLTGIPLPTYTTSTPQNQQNKQNLPKFFPLNEVCSPPQGPYGINAPCPLPATVQKDYIGYMQHRRDEFTFVEVVLAAKQTHSIQNNLATFLNAYPQTFRIAPIINGTEQLTTTATTLFGGAIYEGKRKIFEQFKQSVDGPEANANGNLGHTSDNSSAHNGIAPRIIPPFSTSSRQRMSSGVPTTDSHVSRGAALVGVDTISTVNTTESLSNTNDQNSYTDHQYHPLHQMPPLSGHQYNADGVPSSNNSSNNVPSSVGNDITSTPINVTAQILSNQASLSITKHHPSASPGAVNSYTHSVLGMGNARTGGALMYDVNGGVGFGDVHSPQVEVIHRANNNNNGLRSDVPHQRSMVSANNSSFGAITINDNRIHSQQQFSSSTTMSAISSSASHLHQHRLLLIQNDQKTQQSQPQQQYQRNVQGPFYYPGHFSGDSSNNPTNVATNHSPNNTRNATPSISSHQQSIPKSNTLADLHHRARGSVAGSIISPGSSFGSTVALSTGFHSEVGLSTGGAAVTTAPSLKKAISGVGYQYSNTPSYINGLPVQVPTIYTDSSHFVSEYLTSIAGSPQPFISTLASTLGAVLFKGVTGRNANNTAVCENLSVPFPPLAVAQQHITFLHLKQTSDPRIVWGPKSPSVGFIPIDFLVPLGSHLYNYIFSPTLGDLYKSFSLTKQNHENVCFLRDAVALRLRKWQISVGNLCCPTVYNANFGLLKQAAVEFNKKMMMQKSRGDYISALPHLLINLDLTQLELHIGRIINSDPVLRRGLREQFGTFARNSYNNNNNNHSNNTSARNSLGSGLYSHYSFTTKPRNNSTSGSKLVSVTESSSNHHNQSLATEQSNLGNIERDYLNAVFIATVGRKNLVLSTELQQYGGIEYREKMVNSYCPIDPSLYQQYQSQQQQQRQHRGDSKNQTSGIFGLDSIDSSQSVFAELSSQGGDPKQEDYPLISGSQPDVGERVCQNFGPVASQRIPHYRPHHNEERHHSHNNISFNPQEHPSIRGHNANGRASGGEQYHYSKNTKSRRNNDHEQLPPIQQRINSSAADRYNDYQYALNNPTKDNYFSGAEFSTSGSTMNGGWGGNNSEMLRNTTSTDQSGFLMHQFTSHHSNLSYGNQDVAVLINNQKVIGNNLIQKLKSCAGNKNIKQDSHTGDVNNATVTYTAVDNSIPHMSSIATTTHTTAPPMMMHGSNHLHFKNPLQPLNVVATMPKQMQKPRHSSIMLSTKRYSCNHPLSSGGFYHSPTMRDWNYQNNINQNTQHVLTEEQFDLLNQEHLFYIAPGLNVKKTSLAAIHDLIAYHHYVFSPDLEQAQNIPAQMLSPELVQQRLIIDTQLGVDGYFDQMTRAPQSIVKTTTTTATTTTSVTHPQNKPIFHATSRTLKFQQYLAQLGPWCCTVIDEKYHAQHYNDFRLHPFMSPFISHSHEPSSFPAISPHQPDRDTSLFPSKSEHPHDANCISQQQQGQHNQPSPSPSGHHHYSYYGHLHLADPPSSDYCPSYGVSDNGRDSNNFNNPYYQNHETQSLPDNCWFSENSVHQEIEGFNHVTTGPNGSFIHNTDSSMGGDSDNNHSSDHSQMCDKRLTDSATFAHRIAIEGLHSSSHQNGSLDGVNRIIDYSHNNLHYLHQSHNTRQISGSITPTSSRTNGPDGDQSSDGEDFLPPLRNGYGISNHDNSGRYRNRDQDFFNGSDSSSRDLEFSGDTGSQNHQNLSPQFVDVNTTGSPSEDSLSAITPNSNAVLFHPNKNNCSNQNNTHCNYNLNNSRVFPQNSLSSNHFVNPNNKTSPNHNNNRPTHPEEDSRGGSPFGGPAGGSNTEFSEENSPYDRLYNHYHHQYSYPGVALSAQLHHDKTQLSLNHPSNTIKNTISVIANHPIDSGPNSLHNNPTAGSKGSNSSNNNNGGLYRDTELSSITSPITMSSSSKRQQQSGRDGDASNRDDHPQQRTSAMDDSYVPSPSPAMGNRHYNTNGNSQQLHHTPKMASPSNSPAQQGYVRQLLLQPVVALSQRDQDDLTGYGSGNGIDIAMIVDQQILLKQSLHPQSSSSSSSQQQQQQQNPHNQLKQLKQQNIVPFKNTTNNNNNTTNSHINLTANITAGRPIHNESLTGSSIGSGSETDNPLMKSLQHRHHQNKPHVPEYQQYSSLPNTPRRQQPQQRKNPRSAFFSVLFQSINAPQQSSLQTVGGQTTTLSSHPPPTVTSSVPMHSDTNLTTSTNVTTATVLHQPTQPQQQQLLHDFFITIDGTIYSLPVEEVSPAVRKSLLVELDLKSSPLCFYIGTHVFSSKSSHLQLSFTNTAHMVFIELLNLLQQANAVFTVPYLAYPPITHPTFTNTAKPQNQSSSSVNGIVDPTTTNANHNTTIFNHYAAVATYITNQISITRPDALRAFVKHARSRHDALLHSALTKKYSVIALLLPHLIPTSPLTRSTPVHTAMTQASIGSQLNSLAISSRTKALGLTAGLISGSAVWKESPENFFCLVTEIFENYFIGDLSVNANGQILNSFALLYSLQAAEYYQWALNRLELLLEWERLRVEWIESVLLLFSEQARALQTKLLGSGKHIPLDEKYVHVPLLSGFKNHQHGQQHQTQSQQSSSQSQQQQQQQQQQQYNFQSYSIIQQFFKYYSLQEFFPLNIIGGVFEGGISLFGQVVPPEPHPVTNFLSTKHQTAVETLVSELFNGTVNIPDIPPQLLLFIANKIKSPPKFPMIPPLRLILSPNALLEAEQEALQLLKSNKIFVHDTHQSISALFDTPLGLNPVYYEAKE